MLPALAIRNQMFKLHYLMAEAGRTQVPNHRLKPVAKVGSQHYRYYMTFNDRTTTRISPTDLGARPVDIDLDSQANALLHGE